MPSRATDKRTRLINTATNVAYEKGFRETSLADIARRAKVPLGNVYYYFKTKDDIGQAIVEQHLTQLDALQKTWDAIASPREKLIACINDVRGNKEILARGGCPVGTFCSELHKEGGSLAESATRILAQLLEWIEAQFHALGHAKEAKALAVQLLSALQGVSVLAHAFSDPNLVLIETRRLNEWIRSI